MKSAVVINSEYFGRGDDKLGAQLMGAFLRKLWAKDKKPDTIIFYNGGVKLLSEGSDVLDALDGLEKSGVELIACGTCLAFYGLKEKLKAGRPSDMEEISDCMIKFDKVVTV